MQCRCVFPGKIVVRSGFGELGVSHLHCDLLQPSNSRRRMLESTAGEEVAQGLSCKFLNPMWNARCMGALTINVVVVA